MAPPSRSTGNALIAGCCGFQERSAPITPALLIALIQNGAVIPNRAATTPPTAGPTARLMFMPTLFAAIAGLRSSCGTSCGTAACQAGAVTVTAVLLKNVKSKMLTGVALPDQTTQANTVAVRVTHTSPNKRTILLSTMSARAPAGTANRNIGSVLAAGTSVTISGSAFRSVISQPAAALYIQPPTLETTVAIQMQRKRR